MTTTNDDGNTRYTLPSGCELVAIRQARPSDSAGLMAFFDRCSADSLYRRFQQVVRRLPDVHLAGGSELGHYVLVAEISDSLVPTTSGQAKVVAVGDVVPAVDYDGQNVANTAEIALLVEDAYQRRGIGSLMLRHQLAVAKSRGFDSILTRLPHVNATLTRRLVSQFGIITAHRDAWSSDIIWRIPNVREDPLECVQTTDG